MHSLNTQSVIYESSSDLPFLASEAAVDLSKILIGQDVNMESIHALSGLLRTLVKKDSSGAPLREQMTPEALTIVGGAVVASNNLGNPSSLMVDDLLKRALEIIDILSYDDIKQKPEETKEAIEFCIALTREAIDYRQSLRDITPLHPFMKLA